MNLGAALRLRQERTQIASQNLVVLSAAKDLIVGCNRHEILRFAQDDNHFNVSTA